MGTKLRALIVMAAIRSKLREKVKTTHMVLETVIAVISSLVFFPLSLNTKNFNQNCLLNSNIHVTRHTNESVSLDMIRTVFGDQSECDYVTFINVVVALHALIWIWFFFHTDPLRCHNGSTVNLLMPALVCHLIIMLCAFVAGVRLQKGFDTMCRNLEDNNRTPGQSLTCKDYEDLSWTESRSDFYTYNLMAVVSLWLLVGVLIFSIALTGLHLYWDFLYTEYTEAPEPTHILPLVANSDTDHRGAGIINKGALTASMDSVLNHSVDAESCQGSSDDDEYDDGGARAAAAYSYSNQVMADIHGSADPAVDLLSHSNGATATGYGATDTVRNRAGVSDAGDS